MAEVSTDLRTVETINTQTKVYTAREQALLAIEETFLNTYSVVRQPFGVINNVQESINVAFTTLNNTKRILETVSEYQDLVARAINSIPQLYKETAELLTTTYEILLFGTGLTGTYKATPENAGAQLNEFADLFNSQRSGIVQSTSEPSVAYAKMVYHATVVTAGSLMSVIEFTSYTTAVGQFRIFDY